MNVAIVGRTDIEARTQAWPTIADDLFRAAQLLTLRQASVAAALEIRQQLSVIALDCSVALSVISNSETDDGQVSELLARIQESAHRVEDVVGQFGQNFTRQRPGCRMLDLDPIIANAITIVSCESVSRGVRVQFASVPPRGKVLGDESYLRELFVSVILSVMDSVASSVRTLEVTSDYRDAEVWIGVRASVFRKGEGEVVLDAFTTEYDDERIAALQACKAIAAFHNGRLVPIESDCELGFEIVLPNIAAAAEFR